MLCGCGYYGTLIGSPVLAVRPTGQRIRLPEVALTGGGGISFRADIGAIPY